MSVIQSKIDRAGADFAANAEVNRRLAEELRGLDLLQAALLQQRIDLVNELRLEETILGGSVR